MRLEGDGVDCVGLDSAGLPASAGWILEAFENQNYPLKRADRIATARHDAVGGVSGVTDSFLRS